MANGFLSGKYDKSSKFDQATDYRNVMPQFKAENIDKNQALLNLLYRTATQKNATAAQISLAWMMNKKEYIVPIPGTTKLERLAENLDATEIELSAQEVKELDNALNNMEMSDVFGGTKMSKKCS